MPNPEPKNPPKPEDSFLEKLGKLTPIGFVADKLIPEATPESPPKPIRREDLRKRFLADVPSEQQIRQSVAQEFLQKRAERQTRLFGKPLGDRPLSDEDQLLFDVRMNNALGDARRTRDAILERDMNNELFGVEAGEIDMMTGERQAREPGLFTERGKGIGPFGIFKPAGESEIIPQVGEIVTDAMATAQKIPVVQKILNQFIAIGSSGTAAASIAQQTLAGQHEGAQRDAARAGRSLSRLLPFTDPHDPEDFVDFAEITTRLGVSDEPFRIPFLGEIKPKFIIDFAGNVVTDPIIASQLRVGALSSAGEAAVKRGGLATGTEAGRAFAGLGPRLLSRMPSDIRAQMLAGERGLFSVYLPGQGRTILKIGGSQKFIDAPVAEIYDMARRGIAFSKFGKLFNVKPGIQFTEMELAAKGKVLDRVSIEVEEAQTLWADIERKAKAEQIPVDDMARRVLFAFKRQPVRAPFFESPGNLSARGRTGGARSVARPILLRGQKLIETARGIRAEVRTRAGAILEKAEGKAAPIERFGHQHYEQAKLKYQRARLKADEVRVDKSAAELQAEGKPAVPGGVKGDPKRARDIMRRADSELSKAAKFRDQQVKRADAMRRAARGRSDVVGKDRLKGATRMEQEADAMLRKLDDETPGRPAVETTPGQDARTVARMREVYLKYRKDGFTSDQSIWAARAHTLGGADEIAAPFAMRLSDQFETGYYRETDAGILLAKSTDPAQIYANRALTEDGRALLKKSGKEAAYQRWFNRKWYANQNKAKRRNALWDGMAIPEVNDWFKKNVDGWGKLFFEERLDRVAIDRITASVQPLSAAELHAAWFRKAGANTTPARLEAGWARGGDLMRENNLQSFVPTEGGGSAQVLIDAEVKRIIAERFPRTAPDEFGPVLKPSAEDLRKRAIDNLLERKEIGRTRFARDFGDDLDNLVIPPEAAEHLRRVVEVWKDTNTPGELMRAFDGTTQMFKSGATVLFPQYHVRNNAHNLWSTWLAGVRNPMRSVDAVRVLGSIAFKDGLFSFTDALGKKWTAKQLVNAAENRGGLGFGQSSKIELGGIEIDKAARVKWRNLIRMEDVENVGVPRSGKKLPGREGLSWGITGRARIPIAVAKTPIRAPARLGRMVGEASEDAAKLTIIIDQLKKHGDLDVAVQQAKKYLHDYSDVSPFEKTTMRRVIPFYTFSRKNIPLMLETIVSQPARISELAQFQRAMQSGEDPVDLAMIPQFISRGLFGLNMQADGSARVYAGAGLGFEDLQIFDPPEMGGQGKDLVQRLNPLIKAVVQQVTNKDLRLDMPLNQADVAPSVLRHFPKPLRDWMDFDKVERNGQVVGYRMNPTIRNWMLNGPVTSGASRFLHTAERIKGPGSPVRASESSQPSEPLFSLTGLRDMTFDRNQQAIVMSLNTVNQYRDFLESRLASGTVGRFGGNFFIREDVSKVRDAFAFDDVKRDFVAKDPEAARLRREIQKTRVAIEKLEAMRARLKGMSAVERAKAAGGGGIRTR